MKMHDDFASCRALLTCLRTDFGVFQKCVSAAPTSRPLLNSAGIRTCASHLGMPLDLHHSPFSLDSGLQPLVFDAEEIPTSALHVSS